MEKSCSKKKTCDSHIVLESGVVLVVVLRKGKAQSKPHVESSLKRGINASDLQLALSMEYEDKTRKVLCMVSQQASQSLYITSSLAKVQGLLYTLNKKSMAL